MITDLAGKVAFITGAASGIGLGIARALGDKGVSLAIADVRRDELEQAAVSLRRDGAVVQAVSLDVSDPAQWATAVEEVECGLGTPQLVVNNAGVSTAGLGIDEITPELWRRVIDINLSSVYFGVHYFLDGMRRRGSGHFVNTASITGMVPVPELAPYAASKAGIISLSESLRLELEKDDIGVSVLCPSSVRTQLWRTSRSVKGLPDTEVPPSDISGQSASPLGMDPYLVGREVVAAVLENELYIFTHPGMKKLVEERHVRVLAAFGRATERLGSDGWSAL